MSVSYSFGEEEIFAFSRLSDESSKGIFKASVLLYRRISGNKKQKRIVSVPENELRILCEYCK